LHNALKRLDIEVDLVAMSEIDIFAIQSYYAIHYGEIDSTIPALPEEEMRQHLITRNIGYDFKKKTNPIARWSGQKLLDLYRICISLKNHGDISTIIPYELPDFDLMNFSFSCQDLSVAGKMEGMSKEDGSITRSGMYIFGMGIIRTKQPKYVMIENVKNLVGKKFKEDFDEIIQDLQDNNYNTYWEVLNAKDFGVPQNRERVFVMCIRKDIDDGKFVFPEPFDNGVRLKDLLEKNVDEKYYISSEKTEKLLEQLEGKMIKSGTMLDPSQSKREGQPRVYNGISCTLTSRDYKEPRQIVEEVSNDNPNEINVIGRLESINGHDLLKRVYDINGICPTLDSCSGGNRQPKVLEPEYRIRKLIPLECFRLMDFSDEEFYRVKNIGISDSQLYKMSGNSIAVCCPYALFKSLFNK
jgi:DNA (cytosine-5)-methyltransferase 1